VLHDDSRKVKKVLNPQEEVSNDCASHLSTAGICMASPELEIGWRGGGFFSPGISAALSIFRLTAFLNLPWNTIVWYSKN
jgi:hypothetical protein